MITREYCEPMDSRDDLREEIAHFLDHGALKPGSDMGRLRTLAPYASGRPGPRSIRELALNPENAPDWHDCVNAIDRRLTEGKRGTSAETAPFRVLDGASDCQFTQEFGSEQAFERVQQRRAAAKARAHAAKAEADAQADQVATPESAAAAEAAPQNAQEWASKINAEA